MSLHVLADHMASKGRGPDSMLVHMSPREVAGLHALALKHGGSLTINPDTGLPEAGFLDKLLPTIIGGGISYLSGGLIDPMTAAAMVGGVETIRTGSLERGLMAGFGAYGGAGLAQGFMGAGSAALGTNAVAATAAELANASAGEVLTGEAYNQAMQQGVTDRLAAATPGSTFSAGLDAAKTAPLDFAKNNFKYLASTAAPILADQMVPTTTKAPPVSPSFIRQKIVNPDGTVRDLTPVNAADFGSRNFSDVYRGYNDGGIVALAAGGAGTDAVAGAPAPQTVEDLYASIGRTPDAGGLAFWQGNFGTGPVSAAQAASFMESANAVKAKEAAAATGANAGTTGGGVTNLATTGGATNLATTGGTAANVADTSGIATLTGGATTNATAGTSTADAQTAVNNIYRNVLGRDADATGLNFWSNAIANGRSVDSVYQDILASANMVKSAGTLGDFGIKTMTAADATKPYTGFTSTEGNTIADEWVRNTLGREPTAADRTQSWYKDVANLGTNTDAAKVYGQFQGYAGAEAASNTAKKIADAKALLTSKGLTEDDVVKQTGKTIAQLVTSGANLGLGFMQASQLKSLGNAPAGFDFSTITKPKTAITNTASTFDTTNPYGNNTGNALTATPGDITRNPDGTITVQPNIPGRPKGGFPGMAAVKNAYTEGGGSLGYTSYAPKTAAEHAALYNTLTGDSEAAYRYLMGEGANPVKSGVGQISKPYAEAVLGYPASTNKMYNYDATTGKMVRNPDYVAPGRDSKGNVTYGMSINEIKKYLTTNPLSGQELYDWAQSNDASAQDIADATGRKLSEVYAEFRAAAKKAKKATEATATDTGTYDSGGGMATGGMTGYAIGGGLGSLGSLL
jgi:hypothetical protein